MGAGGADVPPAAISEMHVYTTSRHHFTPSRLENIEQPHQLDVEEHHSDPLNEWRGLLCREHPTITLCL